MKERDQLQNNSAPARRRRRKPKQKYIDYVLIIIMIIIIGFGLLMIYSASYYEANLDFGNPMYYFWHQLFAVSVGVVALLITAWFDYKKYYHIRWVIIIVAFVSMFLLFVPGIKYTANGATRWIKIFGITVQPAEIVKIATIIYGSCFLTKYANTITTIKGAVYAMIVPVIGAGLVFVISNNLSSAIIIFGIGFLMLFIASPNYKEYVALVGGGLGAITLFVVYVLNQDDGSGSFRFDRIRAWQHPEAYSDGTSFQTMQALYAIGSGGFWGKGLGESIQKLGFIPEAQNDMIFSIICEELGIFGASLIIILFVILIYRCYYVARNAEDMLGCLLASGVMVHLAIQVVLNIMVVTNLIPNTGISLPFISYGGTSVVFLMAELGIVLNVSKSINVED